MTNILSKGSLLKFEQWCIQNSCDLDTMSSCRHCGSCCLLLTFSDKYFTKNVLSSNEWQPH